MKIGKQKKGVPASFRKELYEAYKSNMKLFGKPVTPYKEWLKDVFNTELPSGVYKKNL